jgi:hypothetical protein
MQVSHRASAARRRRTAAAFLIRTVVVVTLISVTASEASALQFVGRVPFGPPRTAEAGISPIMFVNFDGTVAVSGVIQCPVGEVAHITFELTQGSTVGTGEWTGDCAADEQSRAASNRTWTTIATPTTGSFVPGTGTAGASFTGIYSYASRSADWSFSPINLFRAQE